MSLKIKVCGMKYEANINALGSLEPDFMGFIFYPKSARFIGVDFDRQDVLKLPKHIIKTAVYVNALQHEIIEFSRIYGIGTVQLHGEESPELCLNLKKEGFKVIKAFGIHPDFNFDELTAYIDCVDFFLFDTKIDSYGGSGKTFDWDILNQYQLNIPFMLSGGLSLENLEKVKKLTHPQLYGVDLNSKFEVEPGVKNIALLEEAFKMIRA
ncbi:phosphoribosylanthranilate isomerase [Pedobacter glucosidilyticus]|uniref:phosphoribosylanthranilate isomerase n=1 Tax=Pedobacter glucosidilyticus TaxID=1122941 RepID=UPI000429E807|nr:phosphoribosylanthranilate isomerase [Pedobacter glucosidilyticus]